VGALPADVKLYAGGEDNFCHRLIGAPGQLTDFGTLDRLALAAQKVATVLCEHPTVIAGHAFTTGQIKRSGSERFCPTPWWSTGSRTDSAATTFASSNEPRDGRVSRVNAKCCNSRKPGIAERRRFSSPISIGCRMRFDFPAAQVATSDPKLQAG